MSSAPQKAPFKNLYHKRKVADAQARACFICCKPSSVVLVTSDGAADFFYVCEVHLTDTAFATPAGADSCPAAASAASAVAQAKASVDSLTPQIEVLERTIAEQKRTASSYFSYFTKNKNKSDAKSSKDDSDKDKDKDKDKKDAKEESDKSKKKGDPWDKDQVLLDKLLDARSKSQAVIDTPPRVFELTKSYYIMRLNKHRSVKVSQEESKKVDDLIKRMIQMPTAPKGIPGNKPAGGNSGGGSGGLSEKNEGIETDPSNAPSAGGSNQPGVF